MPVLPLSVLFSDQDADQQCQYADQYIKQFVQIHRILSLLLADADVIQLYFNRKNA